MISFNNQIGDVVTIRLRHADHLAVASSLDRATLGFGGVVTWRSKTVILYDRQRRLRDPRDVVSPQDRPPNPLHPFVQLRRGQLDGRAGPYNGDPVTVAQDVSNPLSEEHCPFRIEPSALHGTKPVAWHEHVAIVHTVVRHHTANGPTCV